MQINDQTRGCFLPDQFQPSRSIRDELDFVTFGDKNSPYDLLQSFIVFDDEDSSRSCCSLVSG